MNDEQVKRFAEMFGEIGAAVPEVDPEDVKAVWQLCRELQKQHPGEQFGIDSGVLQGICRRGADMRAISYRHSHLMLLQLVAGLECPPEAAAEMAAFQEKPATVVRNGEPIDTAFSAVAKVPMKWATQGLPYDFDEFVRLCAA